MPELEDDWLGIGEGIGESDPSERAALEATLRKLTNRIHASSLEELLLFLGKDLHELFEVDQATLFVVERLKNELFTKVQSGRQVEEVRLPVGPRSLPGFVASTGRIVAVADAYDKKELEEISPDLSFDKAWDKRTGQRTRQVLAVPVKAGHHTEGVLQLTNTHDRKPFAGHHKRLLMEIAETLSIAFVNQRRVRSRRSRFDRLLTMALVNEEMLEKATAQVRALGGSVEHCLVTQFAVPKNEVLASLGEWYRVPSVDCAGASAPRSDLLEPFATKFLRHHACVPLGLEGERVVLAIANPKDVVALDEVARRLDRPVAAKVAVEEDVLALLAKLFPEEQRAGEPKSKLADLSSLISELDFDSPAEEATQEEDVEVKEGSSGLVRLVNQVIEHAYERGASDIHIEPYPHKDIEVRFRIDGVCLTYTTIPRRFARALISRIKIMSSLDIAERRFPQDGKIQFKKFGKLDIELRVATLPTVGNLEDCVMRILSGSKPMPLDEMGFLPENLEGFKLAVSQPYGLVLVVGPTGSGKTTTLHSALGYINTPSRKIWTAEDPVEITQEGLRQVQVHPKIGFTFERALRSFLRADPDVIMIGEMRDRETAEAGVEASLTGHLVFSTLHTNSAPETVTRLLDMGIDPYSFGDSLLGVLAQRLIRRLCVSCRLDHDPDGEELERLQAEFGDDERWDDLGLGDEVSMHSLEGCEVCGATGYRGRMGIHEFMAGSEGVREVIYRNGTIAEIRAAAAADGLTTLKQDGIRKVLLGYSDLAEIRRVCIKSEVSQSAPEEDAPKPKQTKKKAAKKTKKKAAKKKAAKKTKKKAAKKKAKKKKTKKK